MKRKAIRKMRARILLKWAVQVTCAAFVVLAFGTVGGIELGKLPTAAGGVVIVLSLVGAVLCGKTAEMLGE